MAYSGRKTIYTDIDEITPQNVFDLLEATKQDHESNRTQIEYLYKYYKGEQPILNRTKIYNTHINNKVVVNRANEIVSFKSGYLMGEPVQYTSRSEELSAVDSLNMLNDYCYSEGKFARDMELAVWFYICGTAYRMVLPDAVGEEDDAPFEIYTLDPRNTYVVYHSGLGHKPIAGITYVEKQDDVIVYSIYTKDTYYEIEDDKLTRHEAHYLGGVPIIEYPANDARLGAFEIVITMLDAINTVESNRIDGVEQFIQALMVFKGVDIDGDMFNSLQELGGIKVPLEGDVSYLIQELNQTQTQTIIDDMYNTVLEICGMPSQGDGTTSDSSNNGAVILRNGWQSAEARAKDAERMFKESERHFLKLVLGICNNLRNTTFRLSNIDIMFTRRNYENILQKSQVLISMLSNGKIHPRLAFTHSGMFVDPELAYTMSEKYVQENKKDNIDNTNITGDIDNIVKTQSEQGETGENRDNEQ